MAEVIVQAFAGGWFDEVCVTVMQEEPGEFKTVWIGHCPRCDRAGNITISCNDPWHHRGRRFGMGRGA